MKILTVAIPCYNSAEYMNRAIDSALVCKNDVEIIIVDDGSTDNTYEIARDYEEKYPDTVRVIKKENGGHGSAVNTGLKNATGTYFKVLDSDDWFDEESLISTIDLIKYMISNGKVLDLYITNYVYEKVALNKRKIMSFGMAIPKNKEITWKNVGHFKMSQNLLMHTLIYRRTLLIDCNLELPEHTFYVDNIFAYYPMQFVKTIYYHDVDLYRYYIGREDQSVNEQVMISRIDQQIKVTKIMIDCCNPVFLSPRGLKKYMIKYMAMIMMVSSSLLIYDGTPESLEKRDDLWLYLKQKNLLLYKIIVRSKLGFILKSNKSLNENIVKKSYRLLSRIYGFN
ncbi:MAG: glycosyltransferase [Lachnospiraceae bacterium]|nr:glycosyltransferase [Lachnospiraceae bacterium]